MYAILGVSIGILVYMISCEIRKMSAYATANNLLKSRSSNEVLDDEDETDDINPGATIQRLNMKTTACTDSLGILTGAISKLRKDHKQKKEQLKQKLETCNVTFAKKLLTSKKFRDNKENDEAFLTKLKINRQLFDS